MRLMIALLCLASSASVAWCQENPLAQLTVSSTRLSYSSGFAEVTYGYQRDSKEVNSSRLDFIVIQTAKHHMFRTCVHLSSKVDDVTPPAYIALEDWPIDLPDDAQIHVVNAGRYSKADADVTLAEIRAWLDQPNLQPTIESLLDFQTDYRAAERDVATKQLRWVPASPQRIAWSSKGFANVLDDHSIELKESSGWKEFTLYFAPTGSERIDRILVELLPRERSPVTGNRKVMLFDIKAHIEEIANGSTAVEFQRCRLLDDETDETVLNCVDNLSDTGWAVPDFLGSDACHQLVLEFRRPITVQRGSILGITIDSGAAPDVDSLSRIRVSFPSHGKHSG
jgi:hypothetical protein